MSIAWMERREGLGLRVCGFCANLLSEIRPVFCRTLACTTPYKKSNNTGSCLSLRRTPSRSPARCRRDRRRGTASTTAGDHATCRIFSCIPECWLRRCLCPRLHLPQPERLLEASVPMRVIRAQKSEMQLFSSEAGYNFATRSRHLCNGQDMLRHMCTTREVSLACATLPRRQRVRFLPRRD